MEGLRLLLLCLKHSGLLVGCSKYVVRRYLGLGFKFKYLLRKYLGSHLGADFKHRISGVVVDPAQARGVHVSCSPHSMQRSQSKTIHWWRGCQLGVVDVVVLVEVSAWSFRCRWESIAGLEQAKALLEEARDPCGRCSARSGGRFTRIH